MKINIMKPLAGLTAATLLLAGCSATSTADGSGPVTYDFVITAPIPGSLADETVQEIPALVSEATDDRVTINLVEEVVGPDELLPALKSGQFAGGHVYTDYLAATYPAWHIASLPGLVLNDDDIGTIMQDVIKPVMNADVTEQADATTVAAVANLNTMLFLNESIEDQTDWKGLSIRTNGAFTAENMKAQGSSPIVMPFSEVYGSVERGIINGTVASPADAAGSSLHEITDTVNLYPQGLSSNQFIFSNTFLDSLTEEERAKFDEIFAEWEAELPNRYRELYEDRLNELESEYGMNIFEPSAEQLENYIATSRPVYEWFESDNIAGEQGAKMVAEIREITGRPEITK